MKNKKPISFKTNNDSFQETIDRMKKLTVPGGLSFLDLNKPKSELVQYKKTVINFDNGLPPVDTYFMGHEKGITTSEELFNKFAYRVIEYTKQVAINMNVLMIEAVFIMDNNEIHSMDLMKHHTDINMMTDLIKQYIKTKNNPPVHGVISNVFAKLNDQYMIIFNIQTRNFKVAVGVPISRNEDNTISFGDDILISTTTELLTNYF